MSQRQSYDIRVTSFNNGSCLSAAAAVGLDNFDLGARFFLIEVGEPFVIGRIQFTGRVIGNICDGHGTVSSFFCFAAAAGGQADQCQDTDAQHADQFNERFLVHNICSFA